MAAIGFLLGKRASKGTRPAGFKMLEQGEPTLLRRKFKTLAADRDQHEYEEIILMSTRRELSRKRFNRGGQKAVHQISKKKESENVT
tara:strand:- start:1957 stop:2217 length:261 start_codon:yes stop_codon:yes gene_type:complete